MARWRGIGTLVLALPLLAAARQPPYTFSEADAMLTAALPQLDGHVAVIVRQNGTELYRFQAGDIAYDTRTRLASFTKTISAGVILALRDEGLLSLDDRLGDTFPSFQAAGLGDATLLDCWAMRHGIDSDVPYEHSPLYTLAQSVTLLGLNGYMVFPPGQNLGYDGAGMQATGRLAELRAGQPWAQIAAARIFDRCAMPQADYLQFDPNPSVPGGLRASAEETMNYAQMVMDRGAFAGRPVLSADAIDQLFTNRTRGLPVYYSPWPLTHPLYPYGQRPDYAFGGWVLAERPATQHVEEVVGAGAWGSYIWLDRRRALTAVLITDIEPGTQGSMDAALGLFDIARGQTEANQCSQLKAISAPPPGTHRYLSWQPAQGSTATRLYGSSAPIRDIFNLRDATHLLDATSSAAIVPAYPYYAATALFGSFENVALVPAGNALAQPAPSTCYADCNASATGSVADFACFQARFVQSHPYADCTLDGVLSIADFACFQTAFVLGCP
jgi:CubicO group peptidase (beta-lactamase class C family)